MQITLLRERPLLPSNFPQYTFYVPNPCILGTSHVKMAVCCKLTSTASDRNVAIVVRMRAVSFLALVASCIAG